MNLRRQAIRFCDEMNAVEPVGPDTTLDMSSPAEMASHRSGYRETWAALVAISVLFVGIALLYAAVIPVFEGFDARAHYRAAMFYRAEHRLPTLDADTAAVSYELITQPPLYYGLSAIAAAAWPADAAIEFGRASVNPFFDQGKSLRQSLTLPGAPLALVGPAWMTRFVALAGGLITVLCTWWLARRLFPGQLPFAIAATAVVAFNPQFLFMSVTISNDAWAAATTALALATAVEMVIGRHMPRAWFWVGAGLGLAALTKYSTLAVGIPVAGLWILYGRSRGWTLALRAAAFALAGATLIAGWWFLRNVQLYGEVVPLASMAEVLPTMRRVEPYTIERTLELVPWLIASFWGVFVAYIAPPLYLEATRWFMMIGLIGIPLALFRLRRHGTSIQIVVIALIPWLILVALSVLYWTRTVAYGEQGRLAHVGASALGVLLVIGWQAWVPQRAQPGTQIVIAGFMLALSLMLVPFLRDGFGLPAALETAPEPDRVVHGRFAGGMELVGFDLPEGATLELGKPLNITLYWTTKEPIIEDYTMFLHLADAQDQLLYQFDGVPAKGRHPTRQWVPGQVFADRQSITVHAPVKPSLATLSIGFYPIGERHQRQAAYDAAGNEVGDRLTIATVRITGEPPVDATSAEQPLLGRWENGISLESATLSIDERGAPTGVNLVWHADAAIHQELTTFVQVLDANNRVLAQVDRLPQSGQWPTSTWRAGEQVSDRVSWSDDTIGWAQVIVGLYDSAGNRVPVVEPANSSQVVVLARQTP